MELTFDLFPTWSTLEHNQPWTTKPSSPLQVGLLCLCSHGHKPVSLLSNKTILIVGLGLTGKALFVHADHPESYKLLAEGRAGQRMIPS